MPEDKFAAYLCGFIDGEGCFRIASSADTYQCQLQVDLREDDSSLLNWLQEKTGLGKIYQVSKAYDRKSGVDSQDQIRWRINRQEEVLSIASIIERYGLRSKKSKEFAIWKQAAILESQGANTSLSGKNKLEALQQELRSLRS